MAESNAREGLDELEEEPGRRPWAFVVIIVLAALVLVAGIQWRRAADREAQLRVEIQALQRENESLRLQAAQAERQVGEIGRRVEALAAERRDLAQKVEELERRMGRARPPAKPAPKR